MKHINTVWNVIVGASISMALIDAIILGHGVGDIVPNPFILVAMIVLVSDAIMEAL